MDIARDEKVIDELNRKFITMLLEHSGGEKIRRPAVYSFRTFTFLDGQALPLGFITATTMS